MAESIDSLWRAACHRIIDAGHQDATCSSPMLCSWWFHHVISSQMLIYQIYFLIEGNILSSLNMSDDISSFEAWCVPSAIALPSSIRGIMAVKHKMSEYRLSLPLKHMNEINITSSSLSEISISLILMLTQFCDTMADIFMVIYDISNNSRSSHFIINIDVSIYHEKFWKSLLPFHKI